MWSRWRNCKHPVLDLISLLGLKSNQCKRRIWQRHEFCTASRCSSCRCFRAQVWELYKRIGKMLPLKIRSLVETVILEWRQILLRELKALRAWPILVFNSLSRDPSLERIEPSYRKWLTCSRGSPLIVSSSISSWGKGRWLWNLPIPWCLFSWSWYED